ncbi:amino acid transporter-like protein [Clohesyomyces aquaticus]|uniref:Amino acid transporter-like protein n=1 Tax=Clohesyomyces aquaticus TaxID=1231657 RepID=A0A1Y1ZPG1_9PLEO|nr:amino acid transporter-like protein [Clohesyomyces aquaticus]
MEDQKEFTYGEAGPEVDVEIISDQDERELAKVGKKSVLRRNFAFLSILGFSCSLMVTWEGLFCVFVFGLMNGGPAGLVYGFFICWVGYLAIVASMGELVSMWPTAGGQYHWVHKLAPPKWRNLLSYITGWQSVIAWQALAASCGYLTATSLQGLVINSQTSYSPTRWHGTLLIFAVMTLGLLFNTFLAKHLPKIENGILTMHIVFFFVVLITLVVLAPHKSTAEEVFTLFLNEGGYESKGLSFFVGLITPVFAMAGADGGVHMSEEIKHASKVLPWAMLGSILINGITGFAMLIAILFCIGDITAALTTPTGYPFIEILTQGTSSIAGGTAVSALLVVMFVFGTIAALASSSRQLWAFARDAAVPNAKFISYVYPRFKIPIVAIVSTFTITCLLSLINIGSAAVFNAIVSLSVAGFFGSYILPFSLILHARITRPETLEFGPFCLGRWGVAINAFAVAWSVLVMFFSFWPTSVPVVPIAMNWSSLLWGATNIFAGVFWVLHGRKVYKGPVVEVRVAEGGV